MKYLKAMLKNLFISQKIENYLHGIRQKEKKKPKKEEKKSVKTEEKEQVSPESFNIKEVEPKYLIIFGIVVILLISIYGFYLFLKYINKVTLSKCLQSKPAEKKVEKKDEPKKSKGEKVEKEKKPKKD